MPSIYNGNPSGALQLAYTIPSDVTDPRNVASVNTPIEGLANDVARLAAGKITPTNPQRTYGHFEYVLQALGDPQYWGKASGRYQQLTLVPSLGASSSLLEAVLDLPHGATLTTLAVGIVPFAVGRAAVPTLMPELALVKTSVSSGAQTLIFDIFDTTATVPAYETAHFVTKTGVGEVIDRTTFTYRAFIGGEGVTNGHLGLFVNGLEAVFNIGSTDQGAG